ncbi:hypothetical protein BOTBODRAFT_43564 [Botryobasidium botryosum FD-172 SS1]|uniref:AB hydrolase-1 domain-containing protein n=1 Tax=Botryobasidium botryosum (strain FD-172 SS1) TaxID=930990 RepID=A0A067MKL2_BOTB1|nr:hypothetical protein BOTBODRAFT_43564 [Botryobasidium botryosum FD-172 SS1]
MSGSLQSDRTFRDAHDYLIPIVNLIKSLYTVIFYNQIGNTHSTHLSKKPLLFWNIDLFIDKLVNTLDRAAQRGEWDIIDQLHHIWAPPLVINRQDGLAQDFFWKIPKAKWVTFENSSHALMLEERGR